MTEFKRRVVLLLAVLAAFAMSAGAATAASDTGSAGSAGGFLYGTVDTDSGNSYTGFLRWGREESFWGDLFNSGKRDLPHMDKKKENGKRRIKIPGGVIRYSWNAKRQFIVRFGDIAEILLGRDEKADVTMRNGTVFRIDGSSNDIGATVTVLDDSLGQVKLPWKKIDRIVFAAVPAGAVAPDRRLHGTVTTEDTTFTGFIQWDHDECRWGDKLDGETEDGDVSIEMGRIRRIEKRNRNSVWVELKDGRRLRLSGSNDVDHRLSGIFVEDERYGRVDVSWDIFEQLEFSENDSSGPGYDDYPAPRAIHGKVTDYDDRSYSGRLVYDLDESETSELLNGDLDGVEYYIPFGRIRSIRPVGDDASEVTLDSDVSLRLGDRQDVVERNAGIVIMREETDREVFVPWRDVKRIDF